MLECIIGNVKILSTFITNKLLRAITSNLHCKFGHILMLENYLNILWEY